MNYIFQKIYNIQVILREKINPYMKKYRQKKIHGSQVTIISNNCWAGHVYRYFGMEYCSPTIGLYFYAPDYVKFCSRLRYYMDQDLRFIDREESKYRDDLIKKNENSPIGVLGDVEIVFLHYKSREEAYEKWNRRKKRIVWDNIVFKMSEQNQCTIEDIKKFSELPEERKFCFVSREYGYKTDVLYALPGEDCVPGTVPIDTILFRKYVDLANFINGDKDFKRKQEVAKIILKIKYRREHR